MMKTHLKNFSLTSLGKVQPRATRASFGYVLWMLVLLLGGGMFEVKAATDCTVVTEIPKAECDALVALYDNTNGATWSDSPNNQWKITNTPCSWTGITCSAGGPPKNVTGIYRTSKNLKGTLPSLGFSLLQSLYLSNNQLSGAIPVFPSKLEYIDLSNNQLTGTLQPLLFVFPAENFLKELNLGHNQLTGPVPGFIDFNSLHNLYLNSNKLTGSIPDFSDPVASSLRIIDLSDNQLSGNIPNFTNIRLSLFSLNLSKNQLSGPIPLNFLKLKGMFHLLLSENQLTGAIPDFAASNVPLRTLYLDHNLFTGEIPSGIANLTKLTFLNIEDNLLTANSLPATVVSFLDGFDPNWHITQYSFPPPFLINAPATAVVNKNETYTYTLTVTWWDKLTITTTNKPAWLTFTDNGNNTALLTGAPTMAGTYPVEIKIQDTQGTTTTQTFNIQVLDSSVVPTIDFVTTSPPTTATVGQTYSYNVVVQGSSPLTLTASKPTWLSLTPLVDNKTALVTGTPTCAEIKNNPHNVTLELKDNQGTTKSQTFAINVVENPSCLPSPSDFYSLTLTNTTPSTLKGGKLNVTGQLISQTGRVGGVQISLTLIAPDNTTQILSSLTNGTGEYTVEVAGLNQVGTYTLQAAFEDSQTSKTPDAANATPLNVVESGITLSEISLPKDQVEIEQLSMIAGQAIDNQQGTWIKRVELTLQDQITHQYLNINAYGTVTFSPTPKWITAEGKTGWFVKTDQVTWVPGHSYLITARVVDQAEGVSAEKTALFTVKEIVIPLLTPTLTLTPLKTRLLATQESTVEVTAKLAASATTSSQPTPDLSNLAIKWQLTAPDTTVTSGDVTTPTGGEVKFTWSGLTQVGTYTLTASFDGNAQLKPAQATVEIKVVPVVKGKFEISQPLDGSIFNSLSVPLIYGQATDPNVKQVKVAIQNQTSHNYLKIENLVGRFVTEETWLTAEGTSFWRLDISKAKFSNNKTYLVRARALDANNTQIGEEVSATFTIDSLKPYTTLYLELNSATILNGDQVNLTGKLNVFPDNGQNLANLPIKLTILSPKQEPTTLLIDTDTTTGQFQLSNFSAFKQPGQYIFTASFAGTDDFSPSVSKSQYLLVGQSAGYVILVQGKIANGEGLAAHNKTVNRIYEKLKERGFEDDNIRYFSYDLKQKGVDAIPNKAEIEKAFSDLQTRINGSPAPFYVIMVDHGSADSRFHIDYKGNNDTIEATQLNTWLTNLESGLTPEALQKPRLVILGACYSGSFIPTLSKPGRIIITSAAENEVSYKGPVEPGDGVRSGELFMEEFFQALGQGDAFTKAFEEGADKIRIFTRQGDAKNKKDDKVTTSTGAVKKRFDDGALQHPLLDDNGDGQGSNVLTLNGDGLQVASFYLGTGPNYDTNFAGNPVDILDVTPTRYLSAQESSAELLMWVNGARRVAAAVVDIRPPTVTLLVDGREHTEQVEIKNLPREFLSCNEQQQRCSTTTHQFDKPGKYEVFYFARDAETTNISPLHYSVVYKDYDGNQPPGLVTLKTPENGDTWPTTLVFDWDKTTDPDGQPVTYTLLIAQDQAFNHIVYRQEELSLSMTYVDSQTKVKVWKDNTYEEQDGLNDQTTYYWKVVAVDSFGAHTDSDVWTFTTNNPNAPPGCSHLTVNDSITGDPIADANIQVTGLEEQPPLYPEEGNYFICLPPIVEGDYVLQISHDGYEEVVIMLDVIPNIRSLHHLRSAASTFLTNNQIQNMPTLQVLLTPKQKPTLPGTIQFEADESSANEKEGTINLIVSRVGGSDGEVTATYELPDGTTQTLTWADGDDNSRIIKVPLGNDKQLGDNFVVKLTAVSGGATLGIVQHTINITDEPTVGKLQFQQTLVKTTDNSKPVPVMVERVGGSMGTISANYTITFKGVPVPNGTGVVNWGEGDTTPKRIEVPVNNLSLTEKEFVQVTLDSPTNSDLLGNKGDEVVTVTTVVVSPCDGGTKIQFAPLTTPQVPENIGELTFTVTRTGCYDGEITVEYEVTSDSTATPGLDYTGATTGKLTWADKDNQPKTFTLTMVPDTLPEPDEEIKLQLKGENLGEPNTVSLMVADNHTDTVQTVQFVPPSPEVKESDGTVTFTVTCTTKDNRPCQKGSVDYSVSPTSTAISNSDYRIINAVGTLTWQTGDAATKAITVTLLNDSIPEPPKTLVLTLTNARSGIELGPQSIATVTIRDDDGPVVVPPEYPAVVQFAQPEYHVTEGEVEYIDILVTITRPDNSPVGEAEVLCNFNNGQLPTHLIWLAHETVAKNCGRIQIKNDQVMTGDRELNFSLSNAGRHTQIGELATTKLVIQEDDKPCTPYFTANKVTVMEADQEVELTVKCTGGAEGIPVTVDYQTDNGTAVAGEDYQSAQGTLTFNQAKTSNLVKIPLIDDDRKEEDKQLVVKLSPPGNEPVTITIQDDDMALPTLGCIATDNTGSPVDLDPETSRCQGGISVAGGDFLNKTIITRNQEVSIDGQMTVAPQHVGKDAELVLFVGYTAHDQEVFLMLDTASQILPWSSNLTDLVAWQTAMTLDKTFTATLYQGLLPPGRLTIFFGYRLPADGMVVQNKLPIEVQIDE